MQKYTRDLGKYILGFIICLLIRLIPFRPANIEPILTTGMPFAKKYGSLAGFMFAFISMVSYDMITGKIGMWTIITALMYGIVALGAGLFFKIYESSRRSYVAYAIIGTLFFDATTGLTIGPLFFNQTLTQAFIGQIPFTVMHLIGNTVLAYTLSPLIYTYIIENKNFETKKIMEYLTLKTI